MVIVLHCYWWILPLISLIIGIYYLGRDKGFLDVIGLVGGVGFISLSIGICVGHFV